MSDSALRDMLPQVSSSSILDALLARITHPAHILDLKSPTPGAVLFGRAATIQFFPTRKDVQHPVDNDFAALFYRAIGAQGGGEGVVLVMSNGGYPDAALGGGRKLTRLRHTGVAGVLTDGRLRDLEGIGTYGFVTYCNGETIRQGGNQVMAMAADVPVEVRGVGVIPGDYVYADAAGAVIVPAGLIAEVLEDAANREKKDLASMERMKDEDPDTVMAQGEAK
ncbi:MAG: RraA family protein [Thermoleophilia bacterium]